MKKWLIASLIFLLFSSAYAHLPRIVSSDSTVIYNPDVSQAFYGELKGQPNYFNITLSENSDIYISLLVPDISGIGKDISAVIIQNHTHDVEVPEFHEHLEFTLNGTNYEWTPYFEEFAGDNYFQGPNITTGLEAGEYEVRISSPDNEGKYVLVVGVREAFTPGEIINTIILLPQLKIFFGTSPFLAYFNIIGLFFFGPIIAVIVAIAVIVKVIRKKKRKQKIKERKSDRNF